MAKKKEVKEVKAVKEVKLPKAASELSPEVIAKKAEKEAQALAKKEAAKLAKKQERAEEQAKKAEQKKLLVEQAKLAKEANKQPIQNNIRRPKPETLCGKAWAIMDSISLAIGAVAPIAAVLEEATKQQLNIGNVKTEYAQWKKFHGVSGRVPKQADQAEQTAEAVEQPDPAV